MKTDELRKTFLNFFAAKGHRVFPSDSLVPRDDPTVLFTSAGMNQFKPMFLGKVSGLSRAASCQKCLRTDDLDKVGKTAFHHTFFEMLGSFSFGDYFKEEAIGFAWEFVTDILKIFPDRLWVSVYEEDSESYDIWLKKINIPEEKILRLGQKENFWPSSVLLNGPAGPCGPCSEIFFDRGKDTGCRKDNCFPSCGCDRFVEVWNLVFTQFNRREDPSGKGYLEPLSRKNIDTGMGLERMASALQGVLTNFEIDIFKPIVKEIVHQAPSAKRQAPNSIYAIADHIRAVTFAIGDGVLPSNEERGYVIRKLIRKAAWHGRSLGNERPFLYKLVPIVAKVMQAAYPDLADRRENISGIVLAEEERFGQTLQDGVNILNNLTAKLKEKSIDIIEGEEIFKLYDTYGFPIELTELIATQYGFKLDKDGFSKQMNQQKRRSRDKSSMKGEVFPIDTARLNLDKFKTDFSGYDTYELSSKVEALFINESPVDCAEEGQSVAVILDKTPFYPQQGGQISDMGKIIALGLEIDIQDVNKTSEAIIHFGKIIKGKVRIKDVVRSQVDLERRLDIARNHTATHLLQSALRAVLGSHVEQAGSWVGQEALRFDFTHFKAISQEQLSRIEELVNEYIRKNSPISSKITEKNLAQKSGALAFFGEKYDEQVRVVNIGDYSKELCAGTHLASTGEIGIFLILTESSIAQGARRIEAATGTQAYKRIRKARCLVKDISESHKISEEKIPNFIEELSEKVKSLEKKIRILKLENFRENDAQNLIKTAVLLEGIRVISKRIDEPVEILRSYTDILKEKADKDTFIILSSADQDKASVLIGLTKDLSVRLDAAAAAKVIASLIGGLGGGKRDLAQAGTKETAKLKLLEDKNTLVKIVKGAKS